MDPLDSTAILDRASRSFLRSPEGGAPQRPIEPAAAPASSSASRVFEVRPRSPDSSMDNPRAMMRRAQQVLEIATMGGSTEAFRRQIAVAAYLAEMEAMREIARLQREVLMVREWSA